MESIETKVKTILERIIPNLDRYKNSKLIDDKIIDSLSVVNLVADLSEAFEITISMSDLIPENFNSVEAICSLIEGKIKSV